MMLRPPGPGYWRRPRQVPMALASAGPGPGPVASKPLTAASVTVTVEDPCHSGEAVPRSLAIIVTGTVTLTVTPGRLGQLIMMPARAGSSRRRPGLGITDDPYAMPRPACQ
jgi:hypothetical protein